VNTICSQCGTVLAPNANTCSFCDSTALLRRSEDVPPSRANPALHETRRGEWRGELNQRLLAYRRRRKAANEGQSALPFDGEEYPPTEGVAVEIEDRAEEKTVPAEDFAFTIAIGRIAKDPVEADPRLLIDVSLPPVSEEDAAAALPEPPAAVGDRFFPLASLEQRRESLLVDIACLAFAYGGFLALFGSLGGHFTFDKLTAAVCFSTFAFVYLQYFGLFTIFGGNTPGMMVTGLQVASFTGETPTPRQYFLRAVGYLLSAATCFLGFLWVIWDEDGLTWHDRLSGTYLTPAPGMGEEELHRGTLAH
jgi:uncharacterized RDD family membrane protein YckC